MRRLLILGIIVCALLLCVKAEAATPFETRTGWVGGSFWVDGSTGNTVVVNRAEGRMNALLVINDSLTQSIFVNWNGAASQNTVETSSPTWERYDTRNPASASTADFELKPGEWVALDPWTANRVEVTGSTGVITEGYARILINYAD